MNYENKIDMISYMHSHMHKYMLFITIFILSFVILLPHNKCYAENFDILNYQVDMIVNEDNTFDITEKITTNFVVQSHGIYRKIPTINTVERQDGKRDVIEAKVSNIQSDTKHEISNREGYKIIKFGDPARRVYGVNVYEFSYKYDLGKDVVKDKDELYFNLIGSEWETMINSVDFRIEMPKDFDKDAVDIFTGSENEDNVEYEVKDNIITGHTTSELLYGEAVTMMINLPEGYFTSQVNYAQNRMIIESFISILFVIIAATLWYMYGRDDEVVPTVEFYPPEGFNSFELAFLYNGIATNKDGVSLLFDLANKGYIRIEEKPILFGLENNFSIIKEKEYDGENPYEKEFFDGLFKDGDSTSKFKMKDSFYKILNSITAEINKRENREIIFEKISLTIKLPILLMLVTVFIFAGALSLLNLSGEDSASSIMLIYGIVIWLLTFLCMNPKKRYIIASIALFEAISLIQFAVYFVSPIYVTKFIILSICMICLIIFLAIASKRTAYGTKMLGKIEGFKNFLELAEKPKLEELVHENPEYFYNILPFTYALGVSSIWVNKFNDIAMQAPRWYSGNHPYSHKTFSSFANSTYTSVSTTMTHAPRRSGGIAGGGSGGGGGGSW